MLSHLGKVEAQSCFIITSHVMWTHALQMWVVPARCRVKVALHHTYIILQVTSLYQQTLDLSVKCHP